MPVGPSVRSSVTAAGTGTGFTIPDPVGRDTTNDALFVLVSHAAGLTFTTPSGWQITQSWFGSYTVRLLTYTAITAAGPWTFGFSASTPYAAVALAVQRGTGSISAPYVDVASRTALTSNSTATCPAVTPAQSNDLLISAVFWPQGTTFTGPGGAVTDIASAQSGPGGADASVYVGATTLSTAGGVATSTVAVTNNNPGAYAAADYSQISLAITTSPLASWLGDFSTGDINQWGGLQAGAPTRAVIKTDTPPAGVSNYATLTALQTDVFPLTPTAGPRCQLTKGSLVWPGTVRWLSWQTRFLSDFPTLPFPAGGTSFFVFQQLIGPPYDTSPNVGFGVYPGDRIALQLFGAPPIWSTPIIRSQWLTFVVRINLAQDATGWIELWFNGQPQRFKNGQYRWTAQNVLNQNTAGLDYDATNYRSNFLGYPSVSVDHAGHRVDTTPPTSIYQAITTAPAITARSAGGSFYLTPA